MNTQITTAADANITETKNVTRVIDTVNAKVCKARNGGFAGTLINGDVLEGYYAEVSKSLRDQGYKVSTRGSENDVDMTSPLYVVTW